jgi:hypothetical protein
MVSPDPVLAPDGIPACGATGLHELGGASRRRGGSASSRLQELAAIAPPAHADARDSHSADGISSDDPLDLSE